MVLLDSIHNNSICLRKHSILVLILDAKYRLPLVMLFNQTKAVVKALGIRVIDECGDGGANLALPTVIFNDDFLITYDGVSTGLFDNATTRGNARLVDGGGAEDVLDGVLHARPFLWVGVALVAPP